LIYHNLFTVGENNIKFYGRYNLANHGTVLEKFFHASDLVVCLGSDSNCFDTQVYFQKNGEGNQAKA
jgi:hypothetical protein